MSAADRPAPRRRPEMWRLFVGVPLTTEVRDAIAAAVAPFRASMRGRWVRPESVHVTLTFLGDVPASQADALGRRAAAAIAPYGPFRAALGEPAGFGHGRRPATVWMGFSDGAARLSELSEVVASALSAPDAERSPRPHVTIARDVPPAALGALHEALQPLTGLAWTVDEAIVWRSHLGPGGSRYEPVAGLPLLGRTAIS